MYGPTVLITTFVDSASFVSDWRSSTSALIGGRSALPSRSRIDSSLDWLRPAIAHRVCAEALFARYSAVSAPVKPVAPNTTMSYSRSGIAAHRTGLLEGFLRRDPGLRRHPA